MKILMIFVLAFNLAKAQSDSVFNGVLKVESEFLEGISVTNLSTKNITASGYKGVFAIAANTKDTLLFSGLNVVAKKIIVSARNLKSAENVIKLQFKENKIESVLVINSSTWAKILGIAPADTHKYTKEERAVKAATENNLKIMPLYISGSLDPFINQLTGRTKKLKKDLVIANKTTLQEKITTIISKENITKLHLIPVEYVSGFLFYLVEEPVLEQLMNEKNYNLALLKIGQLAINFKTINNIVPLEKLNNNNEIISK